MSASIVTIPAADVRLSADLSIPSNPAGLVVFVHGSGSNRFSSRNRRVAQILNENRFATLLPDLLTKEESRSDERTAEFRFDIELLAKRTVAVVDWLRGERTVSSLPFGLFGASTGAAAAIIAATRCGPEAVRALVSRGGRIDLAGESLGALRAPILLVVGELDARLLELHEDAIHHLNSEYRLEIIPGAAHLFEEAGALEHVTTLAAQWFGRHLIGGKG